MKYSVWVFALLFSMVFFFSCNSEKKQTLAQIEALEKKLYQDSLMTLNRDIAINVSDLYILFADKFPDEEKAPEFLFKAATIHNTLLLFDQAVHLYKKLYTNYPDNKKAPVCLFLCGFISENYLHNIERAKSEYTLFLNKFPRHELAKDVSFSIQHLGKSDLDLIREFQNDKTQKR